MDNQTKIVVIGASAAGMKAAARAKRLMPEADIEVYEQADVFSYGACGLPYYLSNDINDGDALRVTQWGTLKDQEFFLGAKGLNVFARHRVENIDPDNKIVEVLDLEQEKVKKVTYDKLVLATGSQSLIIEQMPTDSKRVSTFKTLADARKWRRELEANNVDAVTIIGGGFIGMELAEAFTAMWGCQVKIIELCEHLLPHSIDDEIARIVENHLQKQGVEIYKNCEVHSITDTGQEVEIETTSGKITCSHVVCALGTRPNITLAQKAGIEIGHTGAIKVNQLLQTNHKDIYAAGDCIEIEHAIGFKVHLPLGSMANRQGRVVGDNLAGRKSRFQKVAGSCCLKVFDMTVSFCGVSKDFAKSAGLDYSEIWISYTDKAHYYPESEKVFAKMIYTKSDGKLLGFQAVGKDDSVVKSVDVFGNLVKFNNSIQRLLNLEFAYAPPYASPLDILYVMGAAAINQELDEINSVNPLSSLEGYTVVDVRTPSEVKDFALEAEGVITIPFDQIHQRVQEIPLHNPVLVVCARGTRSAEVVRLLKNRGNNNCCYLGGGIQMRQAGDLLGPGHV